MEIENEGSKLAYKDRVLTWTTGVNCMNKSVTSARNSLEQYRRFQRHSETLQQVGWG